MAQIVVYGHAAALRPRIPELSDAIHAAVVGALKLPKAKKNLIRHLFRNVASVGVSISDLEITITETPQANWGIRGVPADELHLDYPVNV
jgi:hypothetical protein